MRKHSLCQGFLLVLATSIGAGYFVASDLKASEHYGEVSTGAFMVGRVNFSTYPTDYDLLYLILTWPNDARALALGHGTIVTNDESSHEALTNPAFASLSKGIFVSANSHLRLIHDPGLVFSGSNFVSEWMSIPEDYEKTKLDKLALGYSPSDRVGLQFNYLSNKVISQETALRWPEGIVFEQQHVGFNLFALTVATRLTDHLSLGATCKYYHERVVGDYSGHPWSFSRSGWSYDVGTTIESILPSLTIRSDAPYQHKDDKRGERTERRGFSIGAVIKDFGGLSDFPTPILEFNRPAPFQIPQEKLPTTFITSISYVAYHVRPWFVEIMGGYAHDYRGPYREDLWDIGSADKSAAMEVGFHDWLGLRLSVSQIDLGTSNAWGIRIGPQLFRIEYSEMTDLGLWTQNDGVNSGRRILSIIANIPIQ